MPNWSEFLTSNPNFKVRTICSHDGKACPDDVCTQAARLALCPRRCGLCRNEGARKCLKLFMNSLLPVGDKSPATSLPRRATRRPGKRPCELLPPLCSNSSLPRLTAGRRVETPGESQSRFLARGERPMPVVLCPRPECGLKVIVAEGAVGQSVRCPHCGQAIRLSRPASSVPKAPPATLSQPAANTA